MVIHATLDAISCNTATAGSVPAFPAYIGGLNQNTTATQSTSATAVGAGPGTYTKYTYQYVNLNGAIVNQATATVANFVRYCEYPGERLFRKVKLPYFVASMSIHILISSGCNSLIARLLNCGNTR